MGCCFLPYLASSKNRKRGTPVKKILSCNPSCKDAETVHPNEFAKEQEVETPVIDPVSDSNEEVREKVDFRDKKRVTFDLNVKTYEKEDVFIEKEAHEILAETNDEEERSTNKEETQEGNDSVRENVVSCSHRYENCLESEDDYGDLDVEKVGQEEEEEEAAAAAAEDAADPNKNEIGGEEDSSESLFSLSIDSRKQVSATEIGEKEVNSQIPKVIFYNRNVNSVKKENEKEEVEENKVVLIQDESSESLFSWSIDSRKQVYGNKAEEVEVNSPSLDQIVPKKTKLNPIELSNQNTRKRSGLYVHSVMNPVENLTQWKENPISDKENKLSMQNSKPKSGDDHCEIIVVNTSLSSWLVEEDSGSTPRSKSIINCNSVGNCYSPSPKSCYEDRPILGALTLEDINKFSSSPSSVSRRSRSRSPDETPIVGTVGSYWSHTKRNDAARMNTKVLFP